MVLTLYGFPASTCTKTVGIVLKEKDIPFTFVPIDITKGEQKSPEYLKKQPFGAVPVIVSISFAIRLSHSRFPSQDDDGFILYESRAIARYIATKYASQGPALIPTDLKANALFEQAASVETANFYPSAIGLAKELIFKKKCVISESTAVYIANIGPGI